MSSQLIYLDNAATTPMDREVVAVMLEAMNEFYGNPSSIHQFGRQSKGKIETVRKNIAKILNVLPSEIVFTSGGTEANNMALKCGVDDLGVKHIISSKIEHHSIENIIQYLEQKKAVKVSYVKLDKNGKIDLLHLEELLAKHENTMVSLMHGNNEIGNVLPLDKVSDLCLKYKAIFHSDTVQTIGHLNLDLLKTPLNFLSFSAHKIHGPKGVGFIYINKNSKVNPLIIGGAQERNLRGGTENVVAIVGMGKALDLAYSNLEQNETHLLSLKNYFKAKLEQTISGIAFNGNVTENTLSTILNVQFPLDKSTDMLLFNLDMKGLAVSGGSACASGSNKGSHVLENIGVDMQKSNVRFSFSRFTTFAEIDATIQILEQVF